MDKTNRVVDTVVIGGGPAGYAAAIYAARANLKTVVIEQGMPGGQIATTDIVENYPAIPNITGAELGMKLQEHATDAGAESVYGVVDAIERLDDGSFNVVCADEVYHAPTVIVATGARHEPLALPAKINSAVVVYRIAPHATACFTAERTCSLSAAGMLPVKRGCILRALRIP